MTEPLPRQRRHVERMTNGPVFTVSYRMRGRIHTVGNTTDKNAPCSAAASLFSYHSRPIAGVAVLDLGARLVTSTITAPTGCVYFNGYFFVDSLCCLSECQVHKILYRQNGQKWFTICTWNRKQLNHIRLQTTCTNLPWLLKHAVKVSKPTSWWEFPKNLSK